MINTIQAYKQFNPVSRQRKGTFQHKPAANPLTPNKFLPVPRPFLPKAAQIAFCAGSESAGEKLKNIFKDNDIKLVIFDLDGVITQTDKQHQKAWEDVSRQWNLKFPPECDINSKSRETIAQEILTYNQIDSEPTAFANAKNKHYKTLLKNLSQDAIIEGAEESIKTFKKKGYKVAVGSSSSNAPIILEKTGLTDLFDAVVHGATEKDGKKIKGKPAPDIFLYAAEQVGIKPENCLVIEDGNSGIKAASIAGMKSVKIGKNTPDATIRFDSVKDFADLAKEVVPDKINGH